MKRTQTTINLMSIAVSGLLCCLMAWAVEAPPNQPGQDQALEKLTVQYTQLFQKKSYALAIAAAQQALALAEQAYGTSDSRGAQILNDMGAIHALEGHSNQAIPLYQRALSIRESQPAPDDAAIAQSLNNLAKSNSDQGHWADAEPLYARLLPIIERHYPPTDPHVLEVVHQYTDCLRALGKADEATLLETNIQKGGQVMQGLQEAIESPSSAQGK